MLKPLNTAQPSERQLALSKLKGIAGIRVTTKEKMAGESVYVIDIFLRSPLAPSNNQGALQSPTSMPSSQLALHELTTAVRTGNFGDRVADHQTRKTFLEVFELKDKLLTASFGCRCAKRCRLCQEMFQYLIDLGKLPPAVQRVFHSSKGKKQIIEKLLNALVGIIVRAQILTVGGESKCESDEKIPGLVKEFLEL